MMPNGEDIVDVCVGRLGKTSDIVLFRNPRDKLAEAQKFIGDKAYVDERAISTPDKTSRKTELSELQKQDNKQLSSRRIADEHMICRLKTFRVASQRFPLARHRYSQVIMAVCGLVRLRLNRLLFFTSNT